MKFSKKYIASLYDYSLDAYDKLYLVEQKTKYKYVLNWIGRDFNDILDIGVGSGIYFDDLFSNYYIIGIDISVRSLKKAFSRGINRIVDLILSDGEHPPIRDHSIDYVISITVLHHFNDIENFIRQVFKIVREGIALSLLDKVYKKRFIASICKKYGFEYKKVKNDYILFYRIK